MSDAELLKEAVTQHMDPVPEETGKPIALAAQGVEIRYGRRRVISELDLSLATGEITALCGPNGSGKSTLLRAFAGVQPIAAGGLSIAGRPLAEYGPRALARTLAMLPQHPIIPEGLSVAEVVSLSRYPHRGLLGRSRSEDRAAVRRGMALAGVEAFADRRMETLSGGERQRVWLALTLAQGSHILLLDEPTTFLDPQHQVEMLSLVRRIARQEALTVVWVLHDLNHAAGWSDRLVFLRDGQVVAEGLPDAVLTESTVRHVFGLETVIVPHPDTGHPLCVPRM